MKIFNKIFYFNAVAGLCGVLVVSFVFYFLMRDALFERAVAQLMSVNILKAQQLEEHFSELEWGFDNTSSDAITGTEQFDEIQQILLQNTGMGSTGESYLVGEDGKLRSHSRFFPEKPPLSIEIDKEQVATAHTRIDYRGTKVISVSRPVGKVFHWELYSEIDYNEAMKPVERFRNYLIILTFVIAVCFVGISIIVSRLNQLEIKVVRDRALAMLEGQEQERKRLTRELHDGVGQLLTAIRLRIELLPNDSNERKEMIGLLNETIGEVKRISWDVMPGALVDFGLESALKSLCDNTSRYSKIKIDFRFVREVDHELNFETTVAVFRIVQEGMNNILKHAAAVNVDLHIIDKPDEIYVLLKDDGKGFIEADATQGVGLRSIKERARLLGGSAVIHSAVDTGTEVEVHIPFGSSKS